VMQTILKGTGFSNYIGRAQLILKLRQQVNELQAGKKCSTKELHNSTGTIVVIINTYIYIHSFNDVHGKILLD